MDVGLPPEASTSLLKDPPRGWTDPLHDPTAVSLCLGFTCNSVCDFCIISEERDTLKNKWLSLAEVRKILTSAMRERDYERLVISGGEVTIFPRLPRVVRLAKELGFRHVRLQTNGRRLCDEAYCRKLLEAGVDELLVSMHAHEAPLFDRMTVAPGGFVEAWQGIQNARALGMRVITNTVVTTANFMHLEATFRDILDRGVREMEVWFITPSGDKAKDPLVPRVSLVAPHLRAALRLAAEAGCRPVVKYFPMCLLGEWDRFVENSQPLDVVASPHLKARLNQWTFHCDHAADCAVSEACLGLTSDYIRAFGTSEIPAPGPGYRKAELPRVRPGQPFNDYVMGTYQPELTTKGKLHSEALLIESARRYPGVLEISEKLKEGLGRDRVVYGVKQRAGETYWEFYFYNEEQRPDLSIESVKKILAPVLSLDVTPPAKLPPYFMFSFELTAQTLASRIVPAVSVYFTSETRGSGFSTALRGAKMTPENKYAFFFKPRAELDAIVKRLAPAFKKHPAALDELKALARRSRTSVCVAYKAQGGTFPARPNAVYFSGLSPDVWRFFLKKHDFPVAIQEFARARKAELDYLWHDVGADFHEDGRALRWTKASFYGSF